MENKLLELKEQFCKWYCPNKEREFNPTTSCEKHYGCKCNKNIVCDDFYFDFCSICALDDYIKHIRDELNK